MKIVDQHRKRAWCFEKFTELSRREKMEKNTNNMINVLTFVKSKIHSYNIELNLQVVTSNNYLQQTIFTSAKRVSFALALSLPLSFSLFVLIFLCVSVCVCVRFLSAQFSDFLPL